MPYTVVTELYSTLPGKKCVVKVLVCSQAMYGHERRADAIDKVTQAEIFVRGVLVIVVVGQGHADQRHIQGLG